MRTKCERIRRSHGFLADFSEIGQNKSEIRRKISRVYPECQQGEAYESKHRLFTS